MTIDEIQRPLCVPYGGGPVRNYSKKKVISDFIGGESTQKIADALGYSRGYILRIIRREVVRLHPVYGLAYWAGGKRLSNDDTILRALLK